MIIELIDEAVKAGARRDKACAQIGLSSRAVARWGESQADGRHGPTTPPSHKLSVKERELVLATANRPEYRSSSLYQWTKPSTHCMASTMLWKGLSWVSRTVLQGAEESFGKRVVIAHSGAAEGGHHAQALQCSE
jgi:hypothetical protein